jgi:RNA polymerase sigma factor (sigma-70 family)
MTDPQAEQREPVDLERNARLIEELYRSRRTALWAVARRYGIAADQVEDVVQSAIAAVLGAYRGPADLDQLFSYTATAVRNGASKAHRRHARKESHLAAMPTQERNDLVGTDLEVALIDPEASDPAELVVRREQLEAARERIADLPELEREILVLGAAGYGNREIAAIVGLSERAVRKRVTRARRRLCETPE